MFALVDKQNKVVEILDTSIGLELKGVKYPRQIYTQWSKSKLQAIGIALITEHSEPAHDSAIEKLVEIPVRVGGDPVNAWVVESKTQAELNADAAQLELELIEEEKRRVRYLKAICKAKIFEIYSESDQTNSQAEATELLLSRIDNGVWTAEESQRVAELKTARGWIKSMVAFCREKVADGVSTVIDVENLWPVPPAA